MGEGAPAVKGQQLCEACQAKTMTVTYVSGKKVCRLCSKKLKKKKFEEKFQKSREVANAKQVLDRYKKRIKFARQGKNAFYRKDYLEAVISYETYFKILEDGHMIESGQLTPEHFDTKAETLLAAAMLWDLLRLFDRAELPDAEIQFQKYLTKFTLFTVKFPWSKAYRKNLRRYIRWGSPKHEAEFVRLLLQLGGRPDKCFIVSMSFGDESKEVEIFNKFRRDVLIPTAFGRFLINSYYEIGPFLADFVLKTRVLKAPIRSLLKLISKLI